MQKIAEKARRSIG